ncbi:GNAT family N-acetyltransferase [Aestuariibius insulae]|uniref:GNAT family N-acetyltransferase n=1 Tax=Aestuariibius insulae TaxID=2058287 RepID=UPI00345E401D
MAQTLTVRPARGDDLGALDQMMARSFPALLRKDYPPSIMVTAVPLISKAQPGLLRSGTYFVAEDEDRTLIGAGGWSLTDPHDGDRRRQTGHIRHFAVDHRLARRGIGRALMAHVMRQASALGVRRLVAMSTRSAVAFYSAQGFTAIEDVDVPLRPGIRFPAVRMVRGLT